MRTEDVVPLRRLGCWSSADHGAEWILSSNVFSRSLV